MSLPCGEAQTAAGYVLAGGRSTRMGRDKALLELGGQPMIAHSLRILRDAGLGASIAGARSALDGYAPVIEDAGLGPLSGVCAALASTTADYAVFLSVDTPLIPASMVVFLLRYARTTGAAAVVPSVGGFAQTFPAVLDRSALPALEDILQSGKGGCFAAFQQSAGSIAKAFRILPVEPLVQCGQVVHPDGLPAARWFLNVNTPQDLKLAEACLPAPLRVS